MYMRLISIRHCLHRQDSTGIAPRSAHIQPSRNHDSRSGLPWCELMFIDLSFQSTSQPSATNSSIESYLCFFNASISTLVIPDSANMFVS